MTKQCWQESAEPGKRRTRRRQWPGEPSDDIIYSNPSNVTTMCRWDDELGKWVQEVTTPQPPPAAQAWHQPSKPILLIRGWLGIAIAALTHTAAVAIGIITAWLFL